MSTLDIIIGIIFYLIGVVLAAIFAALADIKTKERTVDKDPFLLCYGSYFTVLAFIIGMGASVVGNFPKKVYDFVYDKLEKRKAKEE